MSDKAERWLAEQETALLERIYALDSPPEPEEKQHAVRVDARKVRLLKRSPGPPNAADAD